MIPIAYNLRSMAVRRTTTLASVLGIALVVFVLAAAPTVMLVGSGAPRLLTIIRRGLTGYTEPLLP